MNLKTWALKQNKLKEGTIDRYITALEKVDERMGLNLPFKILEIANYEDFISVKKTIKENPKYAYVNTHYGKYDLSAALSLYERFLKGVPFIIDVDKLKQVLDGYKEYFPNHWNDEKYKWEAVKHFQDHWNIEAEDFAEMFKQATGKTFNLLSSGYSYPKGMIYNFAKADPETTRSMFRKLFDETVDLDVRVDEFQATAEDMRAKYDDGTWKNHYQNTNAISTYLWLRYPDKYYIYKYEIFRAATTVLAADYIPRKNGSSDSMIGGFKMYDEICEAVKLDDDICKMLQDSLSDSCYPDPEYKTATIDVGYYLARYYAKEQSQQSDGEWFPKEYSPKLTVEDWVSLLKDSNVFTVNSLQIVKRMKDYGGQATCKQLSIKYGENANFYNGGSSALAKRIAEKTGCPVMITDTENLKWWPILYTGRDTVNKEEGTFIWRLRSELSEALNQVDLSEIPLYAESESEPEVQKYTKEDFLRKVFMTEERFNVLQALLRNKKNIILQGAPGVGKTFTARKLAYAMMGQMDDSRIEMIQFHQNYTYEDFIMGYHPDGAGFKLTEGIFYRFCIEASKTENKSKDYFFIIDEINRGNLSKIFGELLMLIEKDYRNTEITLAYNGKPFYVPDNLYIIGLMNTADRSLAMIDYALRRRFSFFEMEPGFKSDGFTKYQNAFANETFNSLIDQIKQLNKEITEDKALGSGFQIGHSYFCGRETDGCTEEWMRSVVEFDILPTLSEYWFDDPVKFKRWENNLRGVFDD